MAYDEDLADRIRELVVEEPALSEKKTKRALAPWVERGVGYARSLPSK